MVNPKFYNSQLIPPETFLMAKEDPDEPDFEIEEPLPGAVHSVHPGHAVGVQEAVALVEQVQNLGGQESHQPAQNTRMGSVHARPRNEEDTK